MGLLHRLGSVGIAAGVLLACSGGEGDSATYCEVKPIVESRCERCHGDPQEHGAPFSLADYEATQADYEGEPIYERMARAVRTDVMPPVTFDVEPPVQDLTDHEVETIGTWADAGAPSGGCE